MHNKHMANTKSAQKRIQQNKKRYLRNKAVKSQTRTAIKAYVKHKGSDSEEGGQLLKAATRLIDKAASKNVFHKNKSARLKSRLHKHFVKKYQATLTEKPAAKLEATPPINAEPAPVSEGTE